MTETAPKLLATIKRGAYGLWFLRITGNGYAQERALTSPVQAQRVLAAMVEDGFAIVDPLHYCELYDIFPGESVSQYADSRDATEAPAVAMVGSVPGDNGRGLATDELVF